MMQKPLALVVLGPTASGKSTLAVELAREFDGEVISADSRQVYRDLDIGSGKITKAEMAGVPHHLLDLADPRETFTVADYQKLAREKMAEILARGRLPIICGGTGFYIQSMVDNLALPEVPPDEMLRVRLLTFSTDELFEKLKELDPKRAETIDRNNPHRLIRAIEIATALGQVPPKLKDTECPLNFVQIGLNPKPELLRQKIHDRLFSRLDTGMIGEAKALHAAGLSWERMEALGLEYRYLARLLQNKITREEFETELELAIWHYAKRQLTWFKRDQTIKWVNSLAEARAIVNQAKAEK
jgi:tRNA dimethylallyltransferase